MTRRTPMSRHAMRRAHARGISSAAIDAALEFGRAYRCGDATVYRLDRRMVLTASARGHNLRRHEGVHVVEADDGTVLTTYRNRNPPRIHR